MSNSFRNLLGLGGTVVADSREELLRLQGATDEDVAKALGIDAAFSSAVPVIGESLDPVIQAIVLDENFLPLWKRFFGYDAKSHIEEFALLTSNGKAKFSYRAEADLGAEDSSAYSRETETEKYYGQLGRVTRTAQRASNAKFADLKAREAFLRIRALLLHIEKDLIWGNSTLNDKSLRGLLERCPAANITSLATTGTAGARVTNTGGGSLTVDTARGQMNAGLQYGRVHSALVCAPEEKISLSGEETGRVRWYKEGGKSRIAAGMTVDQIANPFSNADCDLVWNIHMTQERGELSNVPRDPATASLFHASAPIVLPTASAGVAIAGGALPNDDYYYGVAAVGDVDEGPILMDATGYTADNTNGTIQLTLTNPTVPADFAAVRSYRIYRSTTNGTDYTKMRLVGEVAISGVAGGTFTWDDDGAFIPGSRRALLVDETATSLPQLLAPSMRDLADIDNTHRFSVDAEVALMLYDQGLSMHQWSNIGGSVTDPA